VATTTTVANALLSQGLPLPVAPVLSPYPYLLQEQVFTLPCVTNIKTHTGGQLTAAFLTANGATLDEWAQYTSCFAPAVRTHAATSTLAAFRSALTAAFSATPLRYIAVNFQRTALGQTGVGHMSPVAAYDAVSDQALILDVARYRYPPAWVPLNMLFSAMATIDTSVNASRGWIELGGSRGIPKRLPTGTPPAGTGLNGTIVRLCLAGLTNQNDVVAIQACLASAAMGLPPPPPPAPRPPHHPVAACPSAPSTESGGGGILTVWALVATMCVLLLAFTLRQQRKELKLLKQPQQQNVAAPNSVAVEMNGHT